MAQGAVATAHMVWHPHIYSVNTAPSCTLTGSRVFCCDHRRCICANIRSRYAHVWEEDTVCSCPNAKGWLIPPVRFRSCGHIWVELTHATLRLREGKYNRIREVALKSMLNETPIEHELTLN